MPNNNNGVSYKVITWALAVASWTIVVGLLGWNLSATVRLEVQMGQVLSVLHMQANSTPEKSYVKN